MNRIISQRHYLCDVETCKRSGYYKAPCGKGKLCPTHFQKWEEGIKAKQHFPPGTFAKAMSPHDDTLAENDYYSQWLGLQASEYCWETVPDARVSHG